jgi:hypothetical protein
MARANGSHNIASRTVKLLDWVLFVPLHLSPLIQVFSPQALSVSHMISSHSIVYFYFHFQEIDQKVYRNLLPRF